MLDTNIIDKLILDKELIGVINLLIDKRKLRLYITSVLKNQINQIQKSSRREDLQRLVETLKVEFIHVEFAPYGFAYGECYGGLSPDVVLDHESFISGNNKQIEDAMIAATASSKKYQFNYVVTDDKKFIKKLDRQSVATKAITFEEFKDKISQLNVVFPKT